MDTGRVVRLSVRKILEKLKSLCSLRRLYVVSREGAGETASSTLDQGKALFTENEASALGIFDNTRQNGSEDAAPFWHDEGGPDRWASAVEDKMEPRRRPANASTLSRIDLKFLYGWSEDARDPVLGYTLLDSVKATDKRFEVEVALAPADNSPRTLRVDALSLGKNPTTRIPKSRGPVYWTYTRSRLLDLEMGARMQSPQVVASRLTQQSPRAFRGVLWVLG